MKAAEEDFNQLHNLVTNEFLKRVKSGEASTADLKAACDWLKTNDITGVDYDGSPLDKLSKIIPQVDPELVKRSCDKSSGCNGKYAHSKKYKRKHAKLRDKLKCKKNEDVSKRKGKWVCESLKINRGRGGAKRK